MCEIENVSGIHPEQHTKKSGSWKIKYKCGLSRLIRQSIYSQQQRQSTEGRPDSL